MEGTNLPEEGKEENELSKGLSGVLHYLVNFADEEIKALKFTYPMSSELVTIQALAPKEPALWRETGVPPLRRSANTEEAPVRSSPGETGAR